MKKRPRREVARNDRVDYRYEDSVKRPEVEKEKGPRDRRMELMY